MGETAAEATVRRSFPYKRVSSRRREKEERKWTAGKSGTRTEYGTRTHSGSLEHARHTCEGRILGIELGMGGRVNADSVWANKQGEPRVLNQRLLKDVCLNLCYVNLLSGESLVTNSMQHMALGTYSSSHLVDGHGDSKPALTSPPFGCYNPFFFAHALLKSRRKEERRCGGRGGGGIWAKIPGKGGNLYVHPSFHMPPCGPLLTR